MHGIVQLRIFKRALGRMASAILIGILGSSGAAHAATASNASSPMGTNLAPVNYYSSEQPFLDIFKTNAGWSTQTSDNSETNEEKYLNLDTQGWPITLTAVNEPSAQKFTQVSVLLLAALPSTSNGVYPAGQYVVMYLGQGTITYHFDAVKVASLSTPGRDVINVANPTSGGGIMITITSTDPNHTGDYIRNIQVVQAAQASALTAGQVFSPTFLNLIAKFRTLRFMDWFQTNGSTLASWGSRSSASYMSWSTSLGVPYEVAIQLANAVSADPWVNIPVMVDDNFITQFATLVHTQLGSTQKVYVELSNEVWNSGFPVQYNYSIAQGKALWPNAGSGADYGNNWYGMRMAQTCDIWKSVWGADSGRVVCVMAAQAANPWVGTERLNCSLWTGSGNAPCSAHGIGVVAIAPYFGGAIPSAWTSQPDGGLSNLFASLTSQNDPSIPAGGFIGQAVGWVKGYQTAMAPYALPVFAYEGGQTFIGFPTGPTSALTDLMIAANRDPRMLTAYQTYLQGWKTNGGELFNHYNDIQAYTQYGEWGALESFMQTTSPLSAAPPKWQALQGFISANNCWWANCTATVAGATPMAPTNLTVH